MVGNMSNFALIFFCLLAGILLRLSAPSPSSRPSSGDVGNSQNPEKPPGADLARALPDALNTFVIALSLPAVTLLQLHRIPLHTGLILAAGMAWIQFGLAMVFFAALGKALRWEGRTVGALILTAGIGNTSFVGFPILEAIFGREALGTGVVVDQAGTFLVLSILGIFTASAFSERKIGFGQLLKKIVRFPPAVAMVIALATRSWVYPDWLSDMLARVGDTLVPLALVSVGARLDFRKHLLKTHGRRLSLGLAFKLFFAPLLISALYLGWLGQGIEDRQTLHVILVESAMGPSITSALVAAEYGLAPDLAALMVGVGMAASFLTVLVWAAVIRLF